MARQRINLIPRDSQAKLEWRAEMIPIILALTIGIGSGVSTFRTKKNLREESERLSEVEKQKKSLADEIASLALRNKALELEAVLQKEIKEVLGKRAYWSEVFKELSLLIPPGVWLTDIASADGKGASRKVSLKGETTSQHKVAEFFRALESSFYLRDVRMKLSERKGEMQPELYSFEFTVGILAQGDS